MSVLRDLDRDVYVRLGNDVPKAVKGLHKYVCGTHRQPIPYYSSNVLLANSLLSKCKFRMFVNSDVVYINNETLRFQVNVKYLAVGYCVIYLNDGSWVRKLGGKL